MNVLFINCVLSNTGDAAIFQAAVSVMRRAWGSDAKFVAQDDHSQRVAKLYPDLSVRPSCYWSLAYTEQSGWRGGIASRLRFLRFAIGRWLMRIRLDTLAQRILSEAECDYLRAYRKADVVIATGGTYLVEKYDLGQRIFDMQTALAMDRPMILFTQSLGPFHLLANRRKLGRVFAAARLILLRDQRSKTHIGALGIAADSLLVSPDAAFALADDDLVARPVDNSPLAKPHPHIALSVRRWDHFAEGSAQEGMHRYCAAFAALAVHVIKKYDAQVTFLSTCQGAFGYHDDSHVAARICATLPDDIQDRIRVDGEFHTPGELRELLREFDWVVATRMHLVILALGVGTPVLPIAYEFKTTELFKSLHHEVEPPTIESMTPDSLIEAFERSVEAYGDAAQRLNEAVAHCRQPKAIEVSNSLPPDLLRAERCTLHSSCISFPPCRRRLSSGRLRGSWNWATRCTFLQSTRVRMEWSIPRWWSTTCSSTLPTWIRHRKAGDTSCPCGQHGAPPGLRTRASGFRTVYG
jgi:colanic acid/amylovoran biosynthesis protein